MPSKKSYFKPLLWLDDMRRYWPLWAGAALLTLLVPLRLISSYNGGQNLQENYRSNQLWLLRSQVNLINPAIVVYALLVAGILFGYLFKAGSANGLHALPTTRNELFGTHFTAGLTMGAIPVLALVAGIAWSMTATGIYDARLLLDFVVMAVGGYLWFFAFACFCVMLAGQLWAAAVAYVALNSVAFLVGIVITFLQQIFFFGASTLDDNMGRLLLNCSPLLRFVQPENVFVGEQIYFNTIPIVVYAVLAIPMAALALLVYRHRDLEQAGEFIAFPAVKSVFCGAAGICGGMVSGIFLLQMLKTTNAAVSVLLVVAAAFVCFFGAQMLVCKELAVFKRKNWITYGVMAVVLGGGVCVTALGGHAYSAWLPTAGEISRATVRLNLQSGPVYMTNVPITLDTPEEIEAVCLAHRVYLGVYADSVGAQEHQAAVGRSSRAMYSYNGFDVVYTLTNGKTVHRTFPLAISEEEIARQGSPEQLLNNLGAAYLDIPTYLTENASVMNMELADAAYSERRNYPAGSDKAVKILQGVAADYKQQSWTTSIYSMWDVNETENQPVWWINVNFEKGASADAGRSGSIRVLPAMKNTLKAIG